MRRFSLIIILFFCVISSVNALAETSNMVVVVHKNNPIDTMTRSEVIDLYMGKYVAFPDGRKAMPLDIDSEQAIKADFYKSLVNMSLARVNSYWSRIQFTGRATRPESRSNEQSIAQYISQTDNAIGYISKENLTDNLKVVFELK